MSSDAFSLFRLRPIRPARVSEISETTATSSVPKEERVNFHIGNPLQDARLSSAFLRIALGLDVGDESLHDGVPERVLERLGWDADGKTKLEFLIRLIRKSAPYLPRGGYLRTAPHALIRFLCSHLESQQEPLHYDTGEQSGRREIILASGGVLEALRVFFFALSNYLEHLPARVLTYRLPLPPHLRDISGLLVDDLAADEQTAREQIESLLTTEPNRPFFLLIGALLTEETRRRLRLLGLERPLFFVEVNDAPNHLSLAREAGLVQSVIRILTPAIFHPCLKDFSTVFVLGNAEFLNTIENVHFNLKGTPSASEVELLIYLLEQNLLAPVHTPFPSISVPPAFEGLGFDAGNALQDLAQRAEVRLDDMVERHNRRMANVLELVSQKGAAVSRFGRDLPQSALWDELLSLSAEQVLDALIENLYDAEWGEMLQRSFLSAFCRHQSQYLPHACMVVSGSSRTALGILGFHCGIEEVVVADLSWSYEQCFPHVHAVPLTNALEMDVDAMLSKVDELCSQDPSWSSRGAVVINNPHNATGRVFDEEAICRLIQACVKRGILIIDDLSYQNVVPLDALPEIKTACQIASELAARGQITSEQAEQIVTVHSMSKTDCLAGARLAVVEIRDAGLRQRFHQANICIRPNLAAILICYLFYRGPLDAVRAYWRLRNALFQERTQAILTAMEHLPSERNPFGLLIVPQAGSMYPLLKIQKLPVGLSLDWLASSLARSGIGMLPLTAFARTEAGFEIARTTFRLTLGGEDGTDALLSKTRRLLIDLNRLIADDAARYNRKSPTIYLDTAPARRDLLDRSWNEVCDQIREDAQRMAARFKLPALPLEHGVLCKDFLERYLPERLYDFRRRLLERSAVSDELLRRAVADNGDWLIERLEGEFMKDSLARRQTAFLTRTHDRTVHPTQMYSLKAEVMLDAVINAMIDNQRPARSLFEASACALWDEYLGRNVAITAQQEGSEILLDLDAVIAVEDYSELYTDTRIHPFLSFWSDWDGSNRPSGQGHLLLAAIVMENVRRMAGILNLLRRVIPESRLDPELLADLDNLPTRNRNFSRLLSEITALTHQLEQRYRSILPLSVQTSGWQRFVSNMHLRRDPSRLLWEHNDRDERKMLKLRQQRRTMLEEYLALNKRLRKQLYSLIPVIWQHRSEEFLLRAVIRYRDLLQRAVITPRIHQGMITARDVFAVDTTAYNLHEINHIAGKYGNPGMVLALQISLSTRADALIALDRKMHMQREMHLRKDALADLPPIWLIPLFEDAEAVKNLRSYLDQVWDYALQSRQAAQSPQQRFAEVIPEIFIAGSDLSQQIGQAASARLYSQAKFDLQSWLAEHDLVEAVRIKLGSGEPMQRQGGYYSHVAGLPAFLRSAETRRCFERYLPAAARQSISYAVTPLQGVFLGRDLRTFQSNISEQLRFLPLRDYVTLLYHVRELQHHHRQDLLRAAEMLTKSRLEARSRGMQELKRLTIESNEPLYEDFLQELTENFRQILYGREEDVVGIHIVSYFIGRLLPQLRDRPTSRRRSPSGVGRGQQILAGIADVVPLARQGSLLRAIVHNQAQTAILGINQLSTGLFRALDRFAQKAIPEAERERLIRERILPHLPVYEILHTLRLYQDVQGEFLRRIETAFPAGNSAFVALREDNASMRYYLPLLQQELLRRHGVDVGDFFRGGVFIADLLPTLRPDLAVLLQENLFETKIERMLSSVSGKVETEWRAEVTRLLEQPKQIQSWRSTIWDILGELIYRRVQIFTELAVALCEFSSARAFEPPGRSAKIPSSLSGFFRAAQLDDEMRRFLAGAVEYLSAFATSSVDVPVSIIRAMNDIERLAQIEESTLSPAKQDAIRYCLLQIARLTKEGG